MKTVNKKMSDMNFIVGIIYSKFDEKIGPDAFVWEPKDLSREIRNLVSLKSNSILTGEQGLIPKSLAMVPIPTLKLKCLIKSMEVKNTQFRGGSNDTSLTLLFKEGVDLIFYKYIKNLEPLFDETANNIVELEVANAGKEKFTDELKRFNQKILNTLEELRDVELQKQEAFPKSDGKSAEEKKYRFKIIVCGDPGVGKTSVVLAFTDKAFRRTYIPTMGVNISEKIIKYNDSLVEFIIWDVAGQAKFQMMRKHFYQSADAQILMLDLTRPKTFQNISSWYSDIEEHLGEKTPGLIIANKKDLINDRNVSKEQIKDIEKKLNLNVLETSALTGENVDESFIKLAETLIKLGKIPKAS